MVKHRVAAAVLVMLTVGAVLVGCGRTTSGTAVAGASATPTVTTTTTTRTTTPRTTSPTSSSSTEQRPWDDVLGPTGWGPVELGMSPTAAEATGAFGDTPTPGNGCQKWTAIRGAPIESAIVSPTIGMAALIAQTDAEIHTPEGVRIGSTAAEVHRAYPAFDVKDVDAPNGPLIEVPGNPKAAYRLNFDSAGKVSFLTLESVDQDCYA